MTSDPILFIDLQAQRGRVAADIEAAICRVLAHGQYILGPEVAQLEAKLAAHCGAKHAIGCSSGTDAIVLALMALDVRAGDAVFVPSFTFAATAESVALVGATPVFIDCVAETQNMDAASLAATIEMVKGSVLRPRGVIAVDMLGQPADYDAIGVVARRHGLWLVGDAAQSFGATYKGKRVGQLGTVTTTSFFPAKPLGCYGDGGAIFTDDDRLAELMRSLLLHGKGNDKYDNVRIGMNGRLDTIQAAILLEKLKVFDDEIERRNEIAARYCEGLRGVCGLPELTAGAASVWAQFSIAVDERDAVQARLNRAGVPTAIYYPKPLHLQTAYKDYPVAPGGLSVSEFLAKRVLSLPMHPYLGREVQAYIVDAVRVAVKG